MRISRDPADAGYRPGLADKMTPERFLVFFNGLTKPLRDIAEADEDAGQLRFIGHDAPIRGRVDIIPLAHRRLPNGWILSVKEDLGGCGFSVAAWPACDPTMQRSAERRWYHDDGSRRAFSVDEIREIVAEIEAALPPVMLDVPPPDAVARIRYA